MAEMGGIATATPASREGDWAMILSQFMTNRLWVSPETIGEIAFKARQVADDKRLSDAGRDYLKSLERFQDELLRVGYAHGGGRYG